MYKHILIATDGSERSAKGVSAGIALAKAGGGKVTVVMASEPFPTYDLASKFGYFQDPVALERYETVSRELAGKVLAKAAAEAEAAGVACETVHVPDATPAAAILATAKERGCDAIVVTSHSRTGLERFMLGSQAERVVRGAEVTVIVVR